MGLLDALEMGETVLILYGSENPPYALIAGIFEFAKRKNFSVLVDDILDMLHVYLVNMELRGFDVYSLKNASVFKIGGMVDSGNVLFESGIDEDVEIYMSRYSHNFLKFLEGQSEVINIVLGFDKLLAYYSGDERSQRRLVGGISRLTGKGRISFYFVNSDVLKALGKVRALLVDSATTVMEFGVEGERQRLKVLRSPKVGMMGRGVEVTRT